MTIDAGAIDRLRSHTAQLSFDVGQHNEPDYASVKISGSLPISRDLLKRQNVRIVVQDRDGILLAEGRGEVTNIAFPDKTDKHGTTTERVHTVTLA